MTSTSATHLDLLSSLASLPPDARQAALRARGDVDRLLIALGDEAEKLVVVEVSRAVASAELVMSLADEIGAAAAQARARRALAQALAYSGRFDEALARCDEAIRLAEHAGESVQAARARLASIHPLSERGRYDEAIARGLEARRLLVAAGESSLAGRADLNLGVVLRKCGRSREALDHFDRAREALAAETPILAQLESNRGEALLEVDDLAGAENAFRASLRLFEGLGHHWGAAIVEGNLADLASRQGRLDRALFHFECARRHVEGDRSPTHLARLLVEQADAKAALGMLDDAVTDYEAAIAVLEPHGQAADLARARAGLARVFVRVGRAREADEALQKAAAEFLSLGQTAPRARLDLIRSDVARHAGRPDDATRLAEAALAALADRPLDAAGARFRLARLALESGDVASCDAHLAAAIETATQHAVTPLMADLLHMRGRRHRKSGDAAAARRDLSDAVDLLDRLRGTLQAERFRAAFVGERLEVYDTLIAALMDDHDAPPLADVFHAIERAKSRALLDVVRGAIDPAGALDAHASPAERGLLDDLADAQSRLNHQYRKADLDPAALRTAAWQQTTRGLEDRIGSVESRLAATRRVGDLHARPAALADVQAALPPDGALIEYFAVEGHFHAVVATRDSVHLHRGLCTIERAIETVRLVHFQMGRASRPGALDGARAGRLAADADRALLAAHQAVAAPLLGDLGGIRRLAIVPHGPLHSLPFAALTDGATRVVDRFDVAVAPSASLLLHVARAVPGSRGRAVVIGVSDDRAPRITAEVRDVARTLAANVTLVNEQASFDAVAAALEGAGVVHLACHGRFDPANPLSSGLRLADRWMTVRDVYRLRLAGAAVTLSGCETGAAEIGSGDEVIGLQRAFLAAGAKSLLATHWLVDDAHAVGIMSRAYKLGQGCGVGGVGAGSLRESQRIAAAEGLHPAVWAAFFQVGAPW
jgi:tetratricopeptide (TPR) repeat protein